MGPNEMPTERDLPATYASKEEVAHRLRLLRTSKGYTLREVEERAGISNAYISKLEQGEADNPTVRVLMALCETYGTTIQELYKPVE